MNKTIVIIVCVVLIALAGWVFMNNSSQNNQPPTKASENKTQNVTRPNDDFGKNNDDGNRNKEEIKTITVEGGSFYFKPNEIRVKKGQKIKIVLNSVSMMHDFVIDELNVRTPVIKNGDSGTVEFTADKVGTFEYYCSIGNHRQMGMVGKLIVEE